MITVKSEVDRDEQEAGGADFQNASTCPNCSALMPREMRFCRLCGCRLGEGVAEYTETVRFQSAADTARNKTRTARARAAARGASGGFKDLGGMAAHKSHEAVKSVTSGLGRWKVGRACKRVPRWMVWVFIPMFVIGMLNGLFSPSSRVSVRKRGVVTDSYLGGQYKTAEGGAFLETVRPPGSAADKAGLVGGDLIITFDGKTVKSQDELSNLLSETPVGKTVDVVYIRDGQTRTAKLTTISEEENERLDDEFDDLPKGFLGVDGDDFKRVQVPGMNIYGVQVNEVYKNRPAYIAGLRNGDIIIEFNGTPIRTPGELNWRIDRARPDSTAKVVVIRNGERLEIPVKMGEE